jgi:nucleoside-diphosphate-sugar epimerase
VYEESKWAAHQIAHRMAAEGVPVVIVMPGAVYGPGDPSFLARLLELVAKHHVPIFAFRDSMVSWVHVDDVVDGIVRAHEKGRPGEDYILGGENETVRGLLERFGHITGVRAPRWWLPRAGMRATLPLGPLIARAFGQSPGAVRDVFRTLDGSIAFSSAKAQRELDYRFRSIEDGFGPYLKGL